MEPNIEFFCEEIREGYCVSEKMKKIWYKEICLLQEFDRVCQKYDLKYFMDYGSLLGVIRHGGFVPWDDDIDVSMPRPDYMRLLEVAGEEFQYPLFFQNTYTDPLISGFSKLMDLETAAIEYPEHITQIHQGIFLDIFPLDDVPLKDPAYQDIRHMQEAIWILITDPGSYSEFKQYKGLLDASFQEEFLSLSVLERQRQFEAFCLQHYGKTEMINFFVSDVLQQCKAIPRSACEEIIYMPFEYIEVPVPKGFDIVLRQRYGDYHIFERGTSYHNGVIFDPEKSYLEYQNINILSKAPI